MFRHPENEYDQMDSDAAVDEAILVNACLLYTSFAFLHKDTCLRLTTKNTKTKKRLNVTSEK